MVEFVEFYRKLRIWLVTLVVFFISLLISLYIWRVCKDNAIYIERQNYEFRAQILQKNIQQKINIAIADLVVFYNTNESVTPSQFKTFVTPFITQNIGIRVLEWIPLVSLDKRQSYEASMQIFGYPNFSIVEKSDDGSLISALERANYYPVTYVEPFESNRATHGFDVNPNETRRQSLLFSQYVGEFSAIYKIKLVQDVDDSSSFLVFYPVYDLNAKKKNVLQHKAAINGFMRGVFRIETLIKNALDQVDSSNIQVQIYDVTSGEREFLYGNENIATNDQLTFSVSKGLDLPQRKWELVVMPTQLALQEFYDNDTLKWVLMGGLGLSFLLAITVFFLLLSKHTKKITQRLNDHLEFIIKERTDRLYKINQELMINFSELEIQKEKAENKSKELEKSNKDLEGFAYVASHDLKSPLRGLDQLASWIAEDIKEGRTDETQENLRLMRNRIQRMERLLTDLLEYSRVGRKESIIQMVNTRVVVEELFKFSSPPEKFQLKLKGDFPCFQTMSVPFEQLIFNLLNNAIKHHHKEEGVITVTSNETESDYIFAFSDDGPGIDRKYHQLIFEMFKSLKPRDEVEGSGMGLALIKKTLDTYAGSIEIHSSLGEGTTFIVSWPKTVKNTTRIQPVRATVEPMPNNT